MTRVTIVGAGLAGLTAAVACAEAGAEVVVHEAHATVGGRARTTEPPWLFHEGPHVFYADGPHWRWLVERDLVGRAATLSLAEPARHPDPPRTGGCAARSRPGVLAMARPPAAPRPGRPGLLLAGPLRCTARRPRGPWPTPSGS